MILTNMGYSCACQRRSFQLQALMLLVSLLLSKCEDVAKVEGDLTIVGLFEIEKRDGNACGEINIESVMILEATRWYIDQLNRNGSLPFKIGEMDCLVKFVFYLFFFFFFLIPF